MLTDFEADQTQRQITRFPPPRGIVANTSAVAVWIASVAPDVSPGVVHSRAIWKLIYDALKQAGATDYVIFESARLSGEKFDSGRNPNVNSYVDLDYDPGNHDKMGNNEVVVKDEAWFTQEANILNMKFRMASLSGNVHLIVLLVKMLLDLLELAGQVKEDEEEKADETRKVQAEILRNARNVAPFVRPAGPKDPPAPGPDGKRITRRVGTTYYVVDEDALEEYEAEIDGDGDGETGGD